MINATEVYKIKITGYVTGDTVEPESWANGTNIHKRGGSGKTWTSKKLVNKSFNEISAYLDMRNRHKKHSTVIEIVTFKLEQVSTKRGNI